MTGNNEIKIHRHLTSRSGIHPGSDRVLALLDHFKVQGVNGEHDVLVLEVVGPSLQPLLDHKEWITVIQQTLKSLTRQIALGTSFLHHCGVVHGGQPTVLSTDHQLTGVIQICTMPTSRSRSPPLMENPREM